MACKILVTWPGMELGAPAVKAQSPNHYMDGEGIYILHGCFLLYVNFNSTK